MNPEQQFTTAFTAFINGVQLTPFDDEYWRNVAKGILVLYEFKPLFADKITMMECWERLHQELVIAYDNELMDDFLNEFTATFINWIPGFDFWTDSLEDFKAHNSYRKYLGDQ